MVMVVVMMVIVAFMPVLDAAVRLGLNRIRLGVAFDNICGAQRFAFQAHRAEQTSYIRTAEEPIRTSKPADGDKLPAVRQFQSAARHFIPAAAVWNPDSAALPRVYLVSW